MANILTPVDVYQLVNAAISQGTGRTDLAVLDTSSLMTVGETLAQIGYESTLKAITTMDTRTILSIRPYTGRLRTLYYEASRWGNHTRKIVPLYKGFEQSGDWNTDLSPNQLADGESIDMYKINKPSVVQFNFYGRKVLEKSYTRFDYQLDEAFRSPEALAEFWSAVLMQISNEIVLANDAEATAFLAGAIAGLYEMGGDQVVDLVEGFNLENGTAYTREQVLTTYLEPFMKYLTETVKNISDFLTDMSVLNHQNVAGYEKIQRHTPKARQRMIMFTPLFTKMQANVLPGIFHPQYLGIGRFEGVNYWQSQTNRTAVNATPRILNVTTGESQVGTPQSVPYVLGLMYDDDFMGIGTMFQKTKVTPENAKGSYYNTFIHWCFNTFVDYTENAILYILGPGGEPTTANANLLRNRMITSSYTLVEEKASTSRKKVTKEE